MRFLCLFAVLLTGACTTSNGNSDPLLCSEECRFSADGECDDGGEDSLFSICAYGTDCMDCGERRESGRPVERDAGQRRDSSFGTDAPWAADASYEAGFDGGGSDGGTFDGGDPDAGDAFSSDASPFDAVFSDATSRAIIDVDAGFDSSIGDGSIGDASVEDAVVGDGFFSDVGPGDAGTDEGTRGAACTCSPTGSADVYRLCGGPTDGCLGHGTAGELSCLAGELGDGVCHYPCLASEAGTQGSCPDGLLCADSLRASASGFHWFVCI